MRRAMAVIALLTLPLSQGTLAEAGWTEPAQVVSVETNIFGRTLVELNLRKNPSNCKEQRLFFRDDTGESSQRMLEVLLEAASNRLNVKLRVSGACHLKGYSEFNAVALVP